MLQLDSFEKHGEKFSQSPGIRARCKDAGIAGLCVCGEVIPLTCFSSGSQWPKDKDNRYEVSAVRVGALVCFIPSL